jgi:hypothetical protein
MPKKVIALPAEEFTDPSTGEQANRPKYTDRADVQGYNSALIPAPDTFPGTSTPAGEIFVAAVTADQSAIDDAQAAPDVWTIGNDTQDDVTPEQAAQFLNDEFRVDPSTITDAATADAIRKIIRDTELEPLTADEWFEQLGVDPNA